MNVHKNSNFHRKWGAYCSFWLWLKLLLYVFGWNYFYIKCIIYLPNGRSYFYTRKKKRKTRCILFTVNQWFLFGWQYCELEHRADVTRKSKWKWKKGHGDLVDKWEETLNKKNVKLCQNLDKNMSTFKITVHRLKVQARNIIFQVVWNVSADWSDVRSMYLCIKYKVDMNAKLTRTTKNNE